MKTVLFITFLFLPFQLFGFAFKSISADYDVSYGFLGRVGTAHASFTIDAGTYKIRIKAQGVGLTKFFSKGREELYESTGLVKDGVLVPTLFVKEKSWGEKIEKKRYFFDYEKQRISVIITTVDGGKVMESRKILPYYAKNDILSLFFNIDTLIGKDLQPASLVNLVAVGANKENGILSVEKPDNTLSKEMKKLLKREDHLLVVILHQKLFSSKRGELFININDMGICDRVVVKDVLFYGDLVGKMKNVKIDK